MFFGRGEIHERERIEMTDVARMSRCKNEDYLCASLERSEAFSAYKSECSAFGRIMRMSIELPCLKSFQHLKNNRISLFDPSEKPFKAP